MSVIGPKVTCHKCGQKLVIDTKGRVPIHDAKNTTIPCVGSLEKPRS
jgi:ribosomal protein S27E